MGSKMIRNQRGIIDAIYQARGGGSNLELTNSLNVNKISGRL